MAYKALRQIPVADKTGEESALPIQKQEWFLNVVRFNESINAIDGRTDLVVQQVQQAQTPQQAIEILANRALYLAGKQASYYVSINPQFDTGRLWTGNLISAFIALPEVNFETTEKTVNQYLREQAIAKSITPIVQPSLIETIGIWFKTFFQQAVVGGGTVNRNEFAVQTLNLETKQAIQELVGTPLYSPSFWLRLSEWIFVYPEKALQILNEIPIDQPVPLIIWKHLSDSRLEKWQDEIVSFANKRGTTVSNMVESLQNAPSKNNPTDKDMEMIVGSLRSMFDSREKVDKYNEAASIYVKTLGTLLGYRIEVYNLTDLQREYFVPFGESFKHNIAIVFDRDNKPAYLVDLTFEMSQKLVSFDRFFPVHKKKDFVM